MSSITGSENAGNDSPITLAEQDRYGFTELAEKLAQSIIRLDRTISTVIGIEGKWGSGKTSLLNLLLKVMKSRVPEGTHVLKVSPWLNPSWDRTVEGMLLPVAAILNDEEIRQYNIFQKLIHRSKSRATPLATKIINYAQHASGRLAPLAELAGNFMPGAGIAASALKTVSTADLSARRQTTAELRLEIEEKIAKLGLNFIVVLDDLDRLEPDQAVEVLRLIRSVADFSGFHYVMCYDPVVLGHAVERGLGVTDGRLYLQKIVPLSFSLPLPESFDLRHEFLTGATALYNQVNNTAPDYTLQNDLKAVADSFGAALSTPREVKLALGSLAFRYESLRDHVWFADLCLLQLLRVTLPAMHNWVEKYLIEHAIVASNSGSVSQKDRTEIKNELKKILSALPTGTTLTVFSLSSWLPGIKGTDDDSLELFCSIAEKDATENDASKRLSSSFYWRYYFAFTPPKDVLPLNFFDKLFYLSENEDRSEELAMLLLGQITDSGFSSRTWFEQTIDKLSDSRLAKATSTQCYGLLKFLFRNGNVISARFRERGEWLTVGEFGLTELADRLLRRIHIDDPQCALALIKESLTDEMSFNWSMSYLRHLLWQNGIVGNRSAYTSERVMSNEELKTLRIIASNWLEDPNNKDIIFEKADVYSLVFGWREISSTEAVAIWMKSVTKEDVDFLNMLLRMRYNGLRSDIGRYQGLRLSDIGEFFGSENNVKSRLEAIEKEGKLSELVQKVRESLSLAR